MNFNFPEKLKIFLISLTFIFTIFLIYFSVSLSPKNFLAISFLDVGQGDSILFQTPRGGKILVDGGRDKTVLERLGKELSIFSKNIDIVIATHDDSDHIAGLLEVVKRYNVKILLYSLPDSQEKFSQELIKVAQEKNVKIVKITKPMIIRSDDGLIIKILFPVKNMSNTNKNFASNDASVVTQFIFGNTKILLTGDLPQTGEKFLVNRYGESLRSNVLKLGHHGSDTSSNPEFLQKVFPEVAIVSAGKNNSFGHPHKSVLNLVEKFGIEVFRTDEIGTINLYSNGLNIWKK